MGFSHYTFDSIYGRTLPCNTILNHPNDFLLSVGDLLKRKWDNASLDYYKCFVEALYSSRWTTAFVAESVWSNWTKRPEVCVNGHEFRPFWPAEVSLYPSTAVAFLFPFHKDEQTEHYRSAAPEENRSADSTAAGRGWVVYAAFTSHPHSLIVLSVLFSFGKPKVTKINRYIKLMGCRWAKASPEVATRLADTIAELQGLQIEESKGPNGFCLYEGKKWNDNNELHVHTLVHV